MYIQEAGNINYANQTSKNTSLANTGANADEVCKINDMASNVREWTTEYSSYTYSSAAYPCTFRGGFYYNSYSYTAYRHDDNATDSTTRRLPSQLVFVELYADRKVRLS